MSGCNAGLSLTWPRLLWAHFIAQIMCLLRKTSLQLLMTNSELQNRLEMIDVVLQTLTIREVVSATDAIFYVTSFVHRKQYEVQLYHNSVLVGKYKPSKLFYQICKLKHPT